MANGSSVAFGLVFAALANAAHAVPAAPTGLAATLGNGTVALAWDDPGNAAITGYQVREGSGTPLRYHSWLNLSTTTSYIFVDLDKGVRHTFQVRAVDGDGRGASAQISATPLNGTATVGEVSINSTPASGDTYRADETIHVRVRFDEAVVVTGRPQLAVTVGSQERLARRSNCHRGGGPSGTCRRLGFRYVVVASDRDSDGISIAADALRLNDSTIEDTDDNAATLNFGALAITNATGHKVEGKSDAAPSVSGAAISSSPASGDSYAAGETITVRVSFDEPVVVTGSPQLALDIGANERAATQSGCHKQNADSEGSCRRLAFSYVVQAADEDDDGIGVAADALSANGGTIRDSGGNDADLDLGSHAISNASGHKVRGTVDAAPSVSGASISSSPASGDSYAAGETITVRVSFDEPVVATGSPQLALDIGANERAATQSGCHKQNADPEGSCRRLAFSYVVQAADEDDDGIGVAADALSANGGTIRDSGGNDADLDLGSHAISNASEHKVRGTVDAAPSVSGASISSSPASGDSYAAGETITVRVSFDEPVVATGSPQLALDIGANERAATQSGCHKQNADSEGSCRRLAFSYVVQAADDDDDGIGVAADALSANGGTIRDSGGNDADLDLGSHAISNASGHKVRGTVDAAPSVSGASISSSPASGDSYAAGETITVRVSFDEPVVATGSPQLALDIGANERAATQSGCHKQNADSEGSCRRLAFSYVVQATDDDDDGIGVAADALSANGGTIRDSGGNDADLDLGSHAISNASEHKVRGTVDASPSVSGASISSSPASGDSYAAGETITVRVSFDEPVVATGSPQLALDIGANERAATQSGCHKQNADPEGSCRRLAFSYVVQATDDDDDGIGVAADALSANGGTIRDSGGNDADLDLGSHAISNASEHKVRGTVDASPSVSGASISSSPASGDSYAAGETITVRVSFDEPVVATGSPQLALDIGANERAATQSGCHKQNADPEGSCRRLAFSYVVQATDDDDDGIGVAADALSANGGTIRDSGGNDADLDLGSHAISNTSEHKVRGTVDASPSVSGASISSSPASGDSYAAGETITVRVSFDEPVVATGSPQLTLAIGSNSRTAVRSGCHKQSADPSGSCRRLAFSYVVQATDEDDDGIGVAADALSANGGTIRDSGGNDADLDLGSHAISNASGHKVRGTVDASPSVSGASIASSPAAGDAYRAGETITVRVSFDEPVVATGSPQLALDIGANERAATQSGCHKQNADPEGSCRRLAFSYVVQATDDDDDGIGVAADALSANGGTIRDSGGNDADLDLGSHAISNASEHKVRGTVDASPSVSGASISSSPASGDAYRAGETITVRVSFDEPVVATGSPQLILAIGSNSRTAVRSGCHKQNADPEGSCRRLVFSYVVQATDEDADGISVAANALSVADGLIQDTGGNEADLNLGGHAIANAAAHRVFGSVDKPPSVFGLSIYSTPARGDTYHADERIRARVWFNEPVWVTGRLRLMIGVGTEVRTAVRARCHKQNADPAGSCRRLAFEYLVKSDDLDADGISIVADAIDLNGGSIRDSGGNDAHLDLARHAIADDPAHKVAGIVDTPPHVTRVDMASAPAVDDVYGLGETIAVRVWFNEPVLITGGPALVLTIGANSRAASRSGCHGQNADPVGSCRRLRFDYVVRSEDRDDNGIGVGAEALRANGGTIEDIGGNAANLDIGRYAFANDSTHRVDGSADDAPTADAGRDRRVEEGQAVHLDGSASSGPSAGASLTYSWRQSAGQPVALGSVGAPRTGFVAPTQLRTKARLIFELTVTDSEGLTATDEVVVTVMPGPNDPPTARAGIDRTVARASRVMLDASGSVDPEGESLVYGWQQIEGPAVVLSSRSSPRPTFMAPAASEETTLAFSLAVTDERGTSSVPSGVSITVADSAAPTFGDRNIAPVVYVVGEPIAPFALPTAIGGDQPISYRLQPSALPKGLAFDAGARRIAGTPRTTVEPVDYVWIATDADGDAAQLRFTIRVDPSTVNRVPEATGAIPDVVLRGGTHATFDLSDVLRDADGDPLAYAISSAASNVATAIAVGDRMIASAIGADVDEGHATTITVVATDPEGLSATLAFVVKVVDSFGGQELEPEDRPLTLTQSALFATERTATMTAISSRPALASVAVQEDMLVLSLGNGDEGVAIVTVVAEQVDGWRVSLDLPVTIAMPMRLFRRGWWMCLHTAQCASAAPDAPDAPDDPDDP